MLRAGCARSLGSAFVSPSSCFKPNETALIFALNTQCEACTCTFAQYIKYSTTTSVLHDKNKRNTSRDYEYERRAPCLEHKFFHLLKIQYTIKRLIHIVLTLFRPEDCWLLLPCTRLKSTLPHVYEYAALRQTKTAKLRIKRAQTSGYAQSPKRGR